MRHDDTRHDGAPIGPDVSGAELRLLSGAAYRPATFVERGVSVPFTTPQLVGARVRGGARERLEFIIGNPSGGRGVYILPWAGVRRLCTPTLHDRLLTRRLENEQRLSPASVWRWSVEAAAEGFAGTEVASAASQASAAATALHTATHYALLNRLVTQLGHADPEPGRADFARRARDGLTVMARRVGQSPEMVATSLEQLAACLVPSGFGQPHGTGRLAATLAGLADMIEAVRDWMEGPPQRALAEGDMLRLDAERVLHAARATLANTKALGDDVPRLVERYARDPDEVAALIERPDWMLDGWQRIILLWRDGADTPETALLDMADLVPAVPREAADWGGGLDEATAGFLRPRHRVRMLEDWRTGQTVQDLIARNERLIGGMLQAGAPPLSSAAPHIVTRLS